MDIEASESFVGELPENQNSMEIGKPRSVIEPEPSAFFSSNFKRARTSNQTDTGNHFRSSINIEYGKKLSTLW